MPNYAIYKTADNLVVDYVVSSPHDPTYPVLAGQAAIKDPDVSALAAVPRLYWKQEGGLIVEMTAPEKAALDAEIAAAAIAAMRSGGIVIISAQSPVGILERAFADIVKDEFNILRQRDRDRSVDVAAATTLADLKTRWAARSTLADRTLAQLRTAMEDRMNTGNVDT